MAHSFDLARNSTATITGGTIIGGTPERFVKATDGSSFSMTDVMMVRGTTYLECPPPTGRFAKALLPELGAIVRRVAGILRNLDREQAEQGLRHLNSIYDPQALSIVMTETYERAKAKFLANVQPDARELMAELLSRVGNVERGPLPHPMRCGFDSVVHGGLAGAHPMAGAADLLEMLFAMAQRK